MYTMDFMHIAELDGKVNLYTKNNPSVDNWIQRIAAGSGNHPTKVKMLLQAHEQFEGIVSKVGKSRMVGEGGIQQ